MRFREPFKVFPKKLKSGFTVYYYTVYDEHNRRKQYSTGCKTKRLAMKYCYSKFKEDNLVPVKSYIFKEYTKDWFIYDKCPYIRFKLSRGFSYSKSAADRNLSILHNHICPYIGNYLMTKITIGDIEKFIITQMKRGISNSTINQYISILKIVFNEAYRLDDIKKNPIENMKSLHEENKVKGVLTDTQVTALFNPDRAEEVWHNKIYYLINLVASQTGMRQGEIMALKISNIEEDHIKVCHSWDRKYGLKLPKNNKERVTVITKELFIELQKLIEQNNYVGEYIFSLKKGIKPINHQAINNNFYKALKAIGITEDERKERNITFHSWRHYYNSYLIKKGVSENIIQSIMGHSNDGKMTKHYTKLNLDDLKNSIF